MTMQNKHQSSQRNLAHAQEPRNRELGDEQGLRPLFKKSQMMIYVTGIVLWVICLAYFWQWWLRPAHVESMALFISLSIILAWITLHPFYFIGITIFAKATPMQSRVLPAGRVAMVVTKTPSEPFSVVRETLEAMLAQEPPHDTWLADEDPSPETLSWCAEHAVKVSSRKNCAAYHQATWPRRTRCKEGNLAYFYDHYGYENYDFVAQLDADHVPTPTYLSEILAPFADAAVGYVSAPSICGKNGSSSWSARSRLYAEGMLHGAFQAGHNSGWAPLCFGSHYAVRTAALKEIGGLGPELAEDHSTTLMMNAAGWRGVHALDAIANGDGPQTFADMVTQEFQWSRSLTTILLKYTPELLPKLPPRLRFQFIFSQLWYPLFSVSMLVMVLMPVVALLTKQTFANVTFPQFVLHYAPQTFFLIGLVVVIKNGGWARPIQTKILSWEGTLFLVTRWPWSLLGVAAALRDHFTNSFVDFRVTPKGSGPKAALPIRVLAPYVFLVAISAIPVLAIEDADQASGFYFFAALNAAIYALVLVVIVVAHLVENQIDWGLSARAIGLQTLVVALVAVLPVVSFAKQGSLGIHVLEQGLGPLRLTRVVYGHSGAGQSANGHRHVIFSPAWASETR